MTLSPCIEVDVSLTSRLLVRLNFLLSNFWRCLSARAETEEITSSEKLKVGGLALWVVVGSGLNEMPNYLLS